MHRNEDGLSFFGFLELRDTDAISHVELKEARCIGIFEIFLWPQISRSHRFLIPSKVNGVDHQSEDLNLREKFQKHPRYQFPVSTSYNLLISKEEKTGFAVYCSETRGLIHLFEAEYVY